MRAVSATRIRGRRLSGIRCVSGGLCLRRVAPAWLPAAWAVPPLTRRCGLAQTRARAAALPASCTVSKLPPCKRRETNGCFLVELAAGGRERRAVDELAQGRLDTDHLGAGRRLHQDPARMADAPDPGGDLPACSGRVRCRDPEARAAGNHVGAGREWSGAG